MSNNFCSLSANISAVLFCISCSSVHANNADIACGELMYKNDIDLARSKIVKEYQPEFPTSPYPTGIEEGCVGISFSIGVDGNVFDEKIKESSHPGFFDKSAKKAIKKYQFEKGSEVVPNAYLVIYFNVSK